MEFDTALLQKLLVTFKDELGEQSQVITEGLLSLEKIDNPEERAKTLTSIFRSAHNVKGSSRSLGVKEVGEIAHHIESMFAAVQKESLPVTAGMVDITLQAVDKMKVALQCFIDEKPLSFDLAALLAELQPARVATEAPAQAAPVPPPAASTTSATPATPLPELTSQDSLRVSIDQIEKISALMEEMQVSKIAFDDEYAENVKTVSHSIRNSMDRHINELTILTNQLQDEIRMLRLVPISNLLHNMPRCVRDMSHQLNKKIELDIQGGDVKVDKMILQALNDPIIHILRNCVDHGIEDAETRSKNGKSPVGKINIVVKKEGGRINITIADDGGGIDLERVKAAAIKKEFISADEAQTISEAGLLDLLFRPGFSVKEIITDISGRGVGLDVVRVNINQIHGAISIKTMPGTGTIFEISVPFTLVSERGLQIRNAGHDYVIPINAIHRVLNVSINDLVEVEGVQAIMVDQKPVPIQSLNVVLGSSQVETRTSERLSLVLIGKDDRLVAFVVDEIIGDKEIVIKPLSAPLTNTPCVAGGTLSGSNKVIIVLNPADLVKHANKHESIVKQDKKLDINKPEKLPHILVVDDSITTRTLEKNVLESKNYQVTVAVNGKEAWDLLQEKSFDLLITDVMMPVMDGFTLTDHVKKSEKLHELPVIIVTSLGSDDEKQQGIDVGADAYIVKNEFESGELLKIVQQLV